MGHHFDELSGHGRQESERTLRQTYRGSIQTEDGKTIRADCDRHGDFLGEATATLKTMFDRLAAQRGWTLLPDTFAVETMEGMVRA